MSTPDTEAQSQTGEEENSEPTTIEELQEDIERTRERLGETVDELSHRLDVKGRAHDKVTDIKAAAQRRTMQRLGAFGSGKRSRQHPREIGSDLLPAHRHDIGVDQLAFHEDGNRSDAAAEIDDGCAQLLLVVRQRGETTCERREQRARDRQMAAFDGEFQIL